MRTENYYVWIRSFIHQSELWYDSKQVLKRIDGTSDKYRPIAARIGHVAVLPDVSTETPYYVKTTLYPSNMYICFGDGDIAESESDYYLSGNKLNVGYISGIIPDVNNPKNVFRANTTFVNPNDKSVTIKELCAFMSIESDRSTPFCIYRKVLNTPLTVPSGGMFTLDIEI